MTTDHTKAPRIYIADDLAVGTTIPASKDHAHYLMTVMRKGEGDAVRLFNGRDGEFLAVLHPQSKKHADFEIIEQLRIQREKTRAVHLYVVPIKKDRMAFLIEKAVELGVTDIHPVMSARCENRKINVDKLNAYIIEASEQCERLTIPALHPPVNLDKIDYIKPTYAAIERDDDLPVFSCREEWDCGILIGPEGGWTDEEIAYLKTQQHINPVSLGDNILRAETAGIFMLSRLK